MTAYYSKRGMTYTLSTYYNQVGFNTKEFKRAYSHKQPPAFNCRTIFKSVSVCIFNEIKRVHIQILLESVHGKTYIKCILLNISILVLITEMQVFNQLSVKKHNFDA